MSKRYVRVVMMNGIEVSARSKAREAVKVGLGYTIVEERPQVDRMQWQQPAYYPCITKDRYTCILIAQCLQMPVWTAWLVILC